MLSTVFTVSLIYVPYIVQIIAHAVAAWHDFRTREIPDKVWLLTLPAIAVTLYLATISAQTFRVLYLASLIAGLTLAALCYIFRIVGGADIKSIVAIALGCPPLSASVSPTLMTVLDLPTIAVVVNALLGVVAYTTYVAVRNRRTFGICESKYEIRGARKIMLYPAVMCVPAQEILEKPHKYAVVRDPRSLTSVLYRIILEDPREALQGVRPDDYVLAVYYMPYIVCILLGLVLYFMTGHSILTLLTRAITTLITRTSLT